MDKASKIPTQTCTTLEPDFDSPIDGTLLLVIRDDDGRYWQHRHGSVVVGPQVFVWSAWRNAIPSKPFTYTFWIQEENTYRCIEKRENQLVLRSYNNAPTPGELSANDKRVFRHSYFSGELCVEPYPNENPALYVKPMEPEPKSCAKNEEVNTSTVLVLRNERYNWQFHRVLVSTNPIHDSKQCPDVKSTSN